jgi:hypothetical protein
MAPSNPYTPRRLSDGMRRKLEVTSAMAWESLVDTHVEQATQVVYLLREHEPVEEALPRYLAELDLGDTMAAAIRTRVLMRFEAHATGNARDGSVPEARMPFPAAANDDDLGDDDEGWSLLRRPQRVVKGVIRRQRRNEEAERITLLAIARAEENVIRTHVENAIGFVALLQDQMPLDRCVQHYLTAIGLGGSRAQTVFQRTMAKLADVHLPIQPPPEAVP